jgi:hypothetical protein
MKFRLSHVINNTYKSLSPFALLPPFRPLLSSCFSDSSGGRGGGYAIAFLKRGLSVNYDTTPQERREASIARVEHSIADRHGWSESGVADHESEG